VATEIIEVRVGDFASIFESNCRRLLDAFASLIDVLVENRSN
jgi:hypothetical protein